VSVTPRGLRLNKSTPILPPNPALAGSSRLRNAHLRRRLREAQHFAHGEEISQMPQFHCDSHYAEKA